MILFRFFRLSGALPVSSDCFRKCQIIPLNTFVALCIASSRIASTDGFAMIFDTSVMVVILPFGFGSISLLFQPTFGQRFQRNKKDSRDAPSIIFFVDTDTL